MLKILDRRGSFPVVDLCSVYEKSSTATCQPRRSQRHGAPTLPNPTTTELPTAEEDRNFLQRLSRVGHSETPETSDEAEPSGDSTLVSAMLGAPRRSQRSHKRSRFMDDEYLLLPWVGRTTNSDESKVVEQRRSVGNEAAVKKRSLKGLFSTETSAKNSPKTPIDSTSPTQKGMSRVVTRRSLGPVVRYPIGTRLNVKYGAVNPQIYEAKVIDVDIVPQVPRYRVHYRGWNKSHDSWITRIDVVSIIEKPSSPSSSSTTGSENAVKPSPDTTPKISTKVFPTDCKLSVSRHKGSGKDSKTITANEMDNDAENKRKKRKQDSEEEEEEERENGGEEGGSIRERRTRSGRWKQPCVVGISDTNEGNPDGEASVSGSDGSPVTVLEIMEVESEARDGTDGGCVESVAEKGAVVATEAGEKPLIDGSERNGEVEDGERSGSSGAEEGVEENGMENGEEGSNGAEEEEEMDGSKKIDDDDDRERDNNGSGDNGRKRDDNDDDDDDDDDENDGEDDEEKEEKDSEDDATTEEERSSDSEEQSVAPSIPVSSRSESEETHPPSSSSETLLVSLDQKSTVIYDSIVTSESSSSCESDGGEPAFGDDVKTMTSDDFLDEETAHDDDDDISVSNSDDACNDLLPAETDSVRSGGTSSITSDHHRRRPDSSGNTTTTTINTTSSGNQLYDAESTRHFARIHSLPPPSTASFIDLEAELKGLDETEKEDYILRKMRKIQIEYKQMSSIYNKLTRRSNRASNRRKSRSRRHGNSVAIATADTEAPPVC